MVRFLILLIATLSAQTALAQFEPLTGIPGLTDQEDLGIAGFVNRALILAITVGGLLAVVKISIAGFKYMFTDIVSTKQSARYDITGALWGLGILLAGAILLVTINPNIQNLDVFKEAKPIKDLISGEFSIRGGGLALPVPETREYDTEAEAEAAKEDLKCPLGWEVKVENTKVYCHDAHGEANRGPVKVSETREEVNGWFRKSKTERGKIIEERAGIVTAMIDNCESITGYTANVRTSVPISINTQGGGQWYVSCEYNADED